MSKEDNLFRAIRTDNLRAAKRAISMGADIESRNGYDHTPLHEACIHNRTAIVRMLLDAGARVDIAGLPSAHDWDLLQAACIDGYTDIVRLLLEHGAKAEMPDADGRRPLHLACENGHPDITQMLLDAGAEVNAQDDHGWTPLHLACSEFGYVNSAPLLLEKGADATVRDDTGYTPLHRLLAWTGVDPVREQIVDWYREHHPEVVMEIYCSPGPGQGA